MKLLKQLQETRNAKIEAMEEMFTIEAENFKVEEIEDLKREIEEINTKIEAIKGADTMIKTVEDTREVKVVKVEDAEQTREMQDEELFLRAVKGEQSAMEELRAISGGDAVIPSTIAGDIIKEMVTLSGVWAKVKKYPVAGKLTFVLSDTANEISVGYVDDEAETPESKPSFKSVAIEDFQIRGLVKISRSLLNKSQFNLRDFIVTEIATKYVEFIENEIFNGTTKIKGLVGLPVARKVTLSAHAAFSLDDLMDVETLVPTRLRANCEFYMHPNTVKELRKIELTTGEKALQKDAHEAFKYTLLGYKVYESDQINEDHIFFGDMSGYYAKEVAGMAIQVLNEKFATQNMTGYHAVAEVGGAPVEIQKIAMLSRPAKAQ